eukprot:TRINITY_DN1223_c0_g1_i11.p1 TRINITY_DN1223_c0_g1~~TRINITY_DN1223_c0_g1_i11.p1  ORF type:complete len:167 (+),score=23.59 TRINITY_DN1223_c0_g1_i11:176-676(+)
MDEIHLSMLHYDLKIVRIPNTELTQCAYGLLNLLFLSSREFFSLTQTNEEISLIINDSDLSHFPVDIQNIAPTTFKAFEATASGPTDVVYRLSKPLAEAGISIFYISTFETNLVLIAEGDIPVALDVLKTRFKISSEGGRFRCRGTTSGSSLSTPSFGVGMGMRSG